MGLFGGGNSTKKTSIDASTHVNAPTTVTYTQTGLDAHSAVELAGSVSRAQYQSQAASLAGIVGVSKLFAASNVATVRALAAQRDAAPAAAAGGRPSLLESIAHPAIAYTIAAVAAALILHRMGAKE